MKRIVSLFLCALIMFLCASVAYGASKTEPVIFVPGYTASRMWINRGTENEKRIWKVDVADEILDAVKQEIPKIAASAIPLSVGYYDALFRVLEPYANAVTEYLRINDDSTCVYPVEVYPHSVETTRLDKLDAYGYRPDHDTLSMLKAYTSPKNIYCCTLDWRLGQVDNAAVLNAYVEDVLRVTGAEKVNIIGVSYGGQVTSSYLSLYGGEKVHRVVLHCPALNGSSIVPQLLSGDKISVAWSDLLKLVQSFRKEETDFSLLTDVVSPDCLNRFVREFIQYYLRDLFLNFGSAWDLVPTAQYPALRDRLLSDGKHQALIQKSDTYHFTVAANLRETFKRLQEEGVRISVIAGYGSALAVDNGMNSDAVIELDSSTGVTCCPLDSTADSVTSSVCKDSTHRHIAPFGIFDAGTAYLPENTWFVEGMFHGLGTNEEKVSTLMCKLLFTDAIQDVHTDPDYPQFLTSENAFWGTVCSFSNETDGCITPCSTELTVRNLSEKESVTVAEIVCDGAKLHFSFDRSQVLQPGESLTAKVWGELPSDNASIRLKTIYVVDHGEHSIAECRTQSFRYAANAESDETAPHIENMKQTTESKISGEAFFALLGYALRRIITNVAFMLRFDFRHISF